MDMKPDGKGRSGPSRESEPERLRKNGSFTEPDPERQPPEPDQADPEQVDPRQPDPDDPYSAALPGDAGPEEPAASAALPGGTGSEDPEALEELPDRPAFPHPQWMVGVVLIFAVLFIAGGLGDPLWLLIGSPFILVLVVYIWVKLASRGKGDES